MRRHAAVVIALGCLLGAGARASGEEPKLTTDEVVVTPDDTSSSPGALSGLETLLQKVQQDINTAKQGYKREAVRRQSLEADVKRLRSEVERSEEATETLKRGHELLETQLHELERQVESSQADAAEAQRRLQEAAADASMLRSEKQHLMASLADARRQAGETERRLAADHRTAMQRLQARDAQLKAVEAQYLMLQGHHAELVRRGEQLTAAVQDLQQQVDAAQQHIAGQEERLGQAHADLVGLARERDEAQQGLRAAQAELGTLNSRLADERAQWAGWQQERQRTEAELRQAHTELLSRFEALTGEHLAQQARAEQATASLSARDQEVGQLRQDRDMFQQRLAAAESELKETSRRLAESTSEVNAVTMRAILAEEERDRLLGHVSAQQTALTSMEQELEQRRRDVPAPSAIETAGRSDAASEPTPPPAAIENGMLTQVRAQLAEALEPESEKGLAQVQQEADRVRITMPERLLFPQGQARLRAEGTAALKRVGAVLKQASDAVIVVEGHTDSVPVGQRMRAQFASNWEFSAARAAAVVRYFLEESGLRSEYVSAAGYADARPIDSNETPAGRAANRRLEILVLSKSSTVLASHHP